MRIEEVKRTEYMSEHEREHVGKFAVGLRYEYSTDDYLTLDELIELRGEIDKVLLRKALGL